MDLKHICYTGIGARKNPKHSVKQFLKVMTRNKTKKQKFDNNISCKRWKKKQKCKSCRRLRRIGNYNTRQIIKNPNYKMNKKSRQKKSRLLRQCIKCSEKIEKEKPCELNDFIKWSGAEVNGDC